MEKIGALRGGKLQKTSAIRRAQESPGEPRRAQESAPLERNARLRNFTVVGNRVKASEKENSVKLHRFYFANPTTVQSVSQFSQLFNWRK